MSKTFTCQELGGLCDKKFSGETFEEIINQGAQHMMSDDEHKKSIMEMEKRTGENKDQWIERMNKEFEAKPEDK